MLLISELLKRQSAATTSQPALSADGPHDQSAAAAYGEVKAALIIQRKFRMWRVRDFFQVPPPPPPRRLAESRTAAPSALRSVPLLLTGFSYTFLLANAESLRIGGGLGGGHGAGRLARLPVAQLFQLPQQMRPRVTPRYYTAVPYRPSVFRIKKPVFLPCARRERERETPWSPQRSAWATCCKRPSSSRPVCLVTRRCMETQNRFWELLASTVKFSFPKGFCSLA